MKIKTITYGMLRKTEMYENDRAEVTDADDFGTCVDRAKALCETALGRKSTLEDQARTIKAKLGGCGGLSVAEIRKVLAASKEIDQ